MTLGSLGEADCPRLYPRAKPRGFTLVWIITIITHFFRKRIVNPFFGDNVNPICEIWNSAPVTRHAGFICAPNLNMNLRIVFFESRVMNRSNDCNEDAKQDNQIFHRLFQFNQILWVEIRIFAIAVSVDITESIAIHRTSVNHGILNRSVAMTPGPMLKSSQINFIHEIRI